MEELDFTERVTILVVDDTPDDLALMSSLLKDTYKVKIANAGERALKIARVGSAAQPDPARYHDARHGRLRGLPTAQGRSGNHEHPGDFPHRQVRGG